MVEAAKKEFEFVFNDTLEETQKDSFAVAFREKINSYEKLYSALIAAETKKNAQRSSEEQNELAA